MPLSTPQKVHLGIVLAGVACLISAMVFPYGVPLIIVWVILANIICFTLKCEKCGQRIVTQQSSGSRGWNWGVCAHCDHRQEK
jgi:hypothetical protein